MAESACHLLNTECRRMLVAKGSRKGGRFMLLSGVMRQLVDAAAGRTCAQTIWERLEAVALVGQHVGMGGHVSSSGEEYFLATFLRASKLQRPLVVLDVGANKGDFTSAVLADASSRGIECRMFAFEPSESAYTMLEQRLGARAGVTLVKAAVGDHAGIASLHYDQPGSGLSSLYKRRLDHFGIGFDDGEAVDIVDLASFCANEGIRCIDLLKLDVEGSELQILEGAAPMLEAGAIGVIQFEFGGCNIDSRTFFQDFWYELSGRYDMYRIVKDGLWPIPAYEERLERFTTTNYVAIRRDGLADSSSEP
jgi:FkbM family methyltransferase